MTGAVFGAQMLIGCFRLLKEILELWHKTAHFTSAIDYHFLYPGSIEIFKSWERELISK